MLDTIPENQFAKFPGILGEFDSKLLLYNYYDSPKKMINEKFVVKE